MRVRLTPEAEADVAQVPRWYSERSSDLGADFFASFETVVHQLEEFPQIAPVVHPPFCRALLRRFPYCVFYHLEPDVAVIVACFHAHRSPELRRIRAGV
jgi:plasmid stabilization system protein ParE